MRKTWRKYLLNILTNGNTEKFVVTNQIITNSAINNMKKILQFGILLFALLAINTSAFSQKKIKKGVVKFKMNMDAMGGDSPEMAMLGSSSLDFYFKGSMQKMDMKMMDGMMRIQTIIPTDNPKDAAILMDMMGQKIQIIELDEDALVESNNFMNIDGIKEIAYDKDDEKEIAGYGCYAANLKMENGTTMKYYITEKIQPPSSIKKKDNIALKGYPLEMVIDAGQGVEMTFTAKEVLGEFDDKIFKIAEDEYTKMTMEEFEKQMGGLGMGLGN